MNRFWFYEKIMKNKTVILSLVIFMCGCAGMLGGNVRENSLKTYDVLTVKSVMILPFTESYSDGSAYGHGESQTITEEPIQIIAMELINSNVKVVERALLNGILTEQKLSLSGIMESQDYEKIGKLVNADLIITGSISISKAVGSRKGQISVRVIDIATGNIVYTASAKMGDIWGGLNAKSFKEPLIRKMGEKIVAFITGGR